ncbi:hypothetical protein, partial [Kitasatospora purpeofusca]|uniref:hypothetical protein n=1 Tax=Kitasatospora purpeofusca TaxID=67352 RepID=UPI00365C4A41
MREAAAPTPPPPPLAEVLGVRRIRLAEVAAPRLTAAVGGARGARWAALVRGHRAPEGARRGGGAGTHA